MTRGKLRKTIISQQMVQDGDQQTDDLQAKLKGIDMLTSILGSILISC